MQTYIGLALHRPESVTFRGDDKWPETHCSLVQRLPGLHSYRWNEVAERFSRDTDDKFQPMPVLGFFQLSFEDASDLSNAMDTASGKVLREFEESTAVDNVLLQVEERIIIEPPPGPLKPGALKTMSVICRADYLDMAGFLHEWRVVHVPLVRANRFMRGYRQNLILRKLRNWTEPVGDTDFPFDGAVELWYDSPQDMQAAAQTEETKAAFAHATKTSARIEKFQVLKVREWTSPAA